MNFYDFVEDACYGLKQFGNKVTQNLYSTVPASNALISLTDNISAFTNYKRKIALYLLVNGSTLINFKEIMTQLSNGRLPSINTFASSQGLLALIVGYSALSILTNPRPSFKSYEDLIINELRQCLQDKKNISSDLVTRLINLSFGNVKINNRIAAMIEKDENVLRDPVIKFIFQFSFHTVPLKDPNCLDIEDTMDTLLDNLAKDEKMTCTLSEIELGCLFHLARLADNLAECDFEGLETNETYQQVKSLSNKAKQIVELSKVGFQNVSTGSFAIFDRNRHYLYRHQPNEVASTSEMRYEHAGVIFRDDHSTPLEIHMVDDGLICDDNLESLSDLFCRDFYEIDFSQLITEEGIRAIKLLDQNADAVSYVENLFAEIFSKHAMKQSSNPLNLECKNLFERSLSLFNKTLGKKRTEFDSIPEVDQKVTCSAFAAMLIEQSFNMLNTKIAYRAGELNGKSYQRYVRSPFPLNLNLEKITPADLKFNFPALKEAHRHLGFLKIA